MLDKIGFIKKTYRYDENKKEGIRYVFPESKDQFSKSVKSAKGDEVVSTLSRYNFEQLTSGIINEGCYVFSNGMVQISTQDENSVVARVAIIDDKTDKAEQYEYTKEEFSTLLKSILDMSIVANPNEKTKYKKLYSQLLNKISK